MVCASGPKAEPELRESLGTRLQIDQLLGSRTRPKGPRESQIKVTGRNTQSELGPCSRRGAEGVGKWRCGPKQSMCASVFESDEGHAVLETIHSPSEVAGALARGGAEPGHVP